MKPEKNILIAYSLESFLSEVQRDVKVAGFDSAPLDINDLEKYDFENQMPDLLIICAVQDIDQLLEKALELLEKFPKLGIMAIFERGADATDKADFLKAGGLCSLDRQDCQKASIPEIQTAIRRAEILRQDGRPILWGQEIGILGDPDTMAVEITKVDGKYFLSSEPITVEELRGAGQFKLYDPDKVMTLGQVTDKFREVRQIRPVSD